MKNKGDILTRSWAIALLALVCSLLWGSAFTFVKIGYGLMKIDSSDWASQMVFAGVRFFIAGFMALIMGSISKKKLLIPQKSSVGKIGIISLFQTILQYFFYYIGLAHTTGVKAAVIVAANVFFAIGVSSFIFRQEKLTAKKALGCIVGFSGIILINLGGMSQGIGLNFIGDGFILLCTIASGFSSAFMKKYSASEDPVLLSGWQFAFGGAVMWIFGAVFGGSMELGSGKAVSVLLYLAFVSAAAYSLWAVLLKHNPVSKVSVYGFMNPMCGVIISSIILREKGAFSLTGGISLLLVCLGIFIVNFEKNRRNEKA